MPQKTAQQTKHKLIETPNTKGKNNKNPNKICNIIPKYKTQLNKHQNQECKTTKTSNQIQQKFNRKVTRYQSNQITR